MQMNPGLILAGQPVNVLGSMMQGNQAAAQTQALQQQNALAGLYKTQGAGILSGDPNALNALAGIDPMAALDVKSTQQGMRAREQEISIARENARLRGMEFATQLSAAEKQQAQAELERGAAMLSQAQTPEQFGMILQMPGVRDAIEGILGPGSAAFENRDVIIASAAGLSEALKMSAPNTPEWRAATPEEAAARGAKAGQINSKTGEFKRTPVDKNTRIVSDGQGGFTIEEGPGVQMGGTGTPTDINPFNVETMTSEIDAIMNDPALPKVTGPIEGGGGNLVDDLGIAQRVYYGSDGLALIEKVGKLQGTTWLAARQFLKGGGPITDYESRKAESAISRLSRVKDDKEFRAALKDLRDAVVSGAQKLQAARSGAASSGSQPQNPAGGLDVGAVEDGYRFLGGDPANPQSWEKVE